MVAEEYLNITNINLLIRFNKTREIFSSVTRVLRILLIAAANSASVESVSSWARSLEVRDLSSRLPLPSFES